VAVVAEDEEGRERKRGRGGGTEEGSPSSSPLAALSLLWTRVLLSEDWKEGLFKTKAVDKVVVVEEEAVEVITTSGIDFIRFRLLHENPLSCACLLYFSGPPSCPSPRPFRPKVGKPI